MNSSLLDVRNLKKYHPIRAGIFRKKTGYVYAVDDISFAIGTGETLGLVGESGCGKTTTGRTILHLEKPTAGSVHFMGRDLSQLNRQQLRGIRKHIQMIFQDPYESLDSRQTIGEILEEPFIIHGIGSSEDRRRSIRDLLDRVGMPDSAMDRFPFEFSGGQRQRIGIARAIALKPSLIVCDEPVSALDVSIQSQILNLLLDLQQDMGLSYLFIAHNMAVVKHISDRIAVMYSGKIVEMADAERLYQNPVHPYTRALISAIPVPWPKARQTRLAISGEMPSTIISPTGCRFNPRCPFALDVCRAESPELKSLANASDDGHFVACHLDTEIHIKTTDARSGQ
jgi:oligopeptide/dipeptide ABC transporter ATP-binding protein